MGITREICLHETVSKDSTWIQKGMSNLVDFLNKFKKNFQEKIIIINFVGLNLVEPNPTTLSFQFRMKCFLYFELIQIFNSSEIFYPLQQMLAMDEHSWELKCHFCQSFFQINWKELLKKTKCAILLLCNKIIKKYDDICWIIGVNTINLS